MTAPSPTALLERTLSALLGEYPFVGSFFTDEGLDFADEPEETLGRALARHLASTPGLSSDYEEDLVRRLSAFIAEMLEFVEEEVLAVREVTVIAGLDKDGRPEPLSELCLRAGEVVCIVGPTGSGKSRLLADLEWLAQGDTPTGRRVLINGQAPDPRHRFSGEHKLVAQLSQTMTFVMDLSVRDFLALHAESRRHPNPGEVTERIWRAANALCGEPFGLDAPVTSLSGGQSRALMIADVAMLSRSPIVLIDEIENAGIDRRAALDVLLGEDKIVLMATHDPLLALLGHRRLVLRNGAMVELVSPSPAERRNLEVLRALDGRLMALRDRLRRGERLDTLDGLETLRLG